MSEKSIIGHLGGIIKSARLKNSLTREQLSQKLCISQRHLSAIENENQKPSYELLFRLIRELTIPADIIFYPEIDNEHFEQEKIRLMLAQCDKKEVNTVATTLQSLLNTDSKEC